MEGDGERRGVGMVFFDGGTVDGDGFMEDETWRNILKLKLSYGQYRISG